MLKDIGVGFPQNTPTRQHHTTTVLSPFLRTLSATSFQVTLDIARHPEDFEDGGIAPIAEGTNLVGHDTRQVRILEVQFLCFG